MSRFIFAIVAFIAMPSVCFANSLFECRTTSVIATYPTRYSEGKPFSFDMAVSGENVFLRTANKKENFFFRSIDLKRHPEFKNDDLFMAHKYLGSTDVVIGTLSFHNSDFSFSNVSSSVSFHVRAKCELK